MRRFRFSLAGALGLALAATGAAQPGGEDRFRLSDRERVFVAARDLQREWLNFVVRRLGEIDDPRTVPALIALLRCDADQSIRARAALALGRKSDRRAVGPLIAALHDRSAWARANAAGALGAIGDERAIVPLVRHRDKEWEPIRATHEALKCFGGRAVDALLRELRSPDGDDRTSATYLLGGLDDPRVAGALVGALDDPFVHVREAAVEGLVARKEARAVEILAARLIPPGPEPLSEAVARLVKDLGDPSFDRRERASEALAARGAAVVPVLRRVLGRETDPEVCLRLERLVGRPSAEEERWAYLALEALARMRTPEARRVLDGLADGPSGSRVATIAREAIERERQRKGR